MEKDTDLSGLKILAIRNLNADLYRQVVKKISQENEEEVIIPTIVGSRAELFDVIGCLNLGDYLGLPTNERFNCIFPEHCDEDSSANIYTMDSGMMVYKCFKCDKVRTIIGITEQLAHCPRSKAIKFIQEIYNIQLEESDWVREQKQILIDSANYLNTEEFKTQLPTLSKLIRTRKHHIQSMLLYYTEHVSDDMKLGDKPLFFGSYEMLMKVCDIKGNDRRSMSQTLALFSLTNMLTKTELKQIPAEELKKAREIADAKNVNKITNYFQFNELGVGTLEDSEEKAKILKENNMTLAGLSREYVLRTFGEEEANTVYPQYKKENAIGTSGKSDDMTIKIARYINNQIEKNGYCLEIKLRTKKYDLQWKKSISDILNSYGFKKVRLNKQLKEQYGIKNKGFPFVILKE